MRLFLVGVVWAILASLAYIAGCRSERGRWNDRVERVRVERQEIEDSLRIIRGELRALELAQSRVDTVYRIQWRTRWRELVVRLQDTVRLSDTVQLPAGVVREVVSTADSTIAACELGRALCDQRAQAWGRLFAQESTMNRGLLLEKATWEGRKRKAQRAAALGTAGTLGALYLGCRLVGLCK